MPDTKQLKLVDGIFNAKDATDILCHLLDKKINFHQCRILSSFERYGEEDNYSKNRIEALKATKKELLETLRLAKLSGENLEVTSDIQINFTTEAPTSKSVEQAKSIA